MVPFYGRVYKSSRYDLIIPLPACESGAEREKRHAVVFASGKTGKANNLIINSLWIVFYVEWHQLHSGRLERTAQVFRFPGTIIDRTPAAGEILPSFLFRGLYLTAKMVYY